MFGAIAGALGGAFGAVGGSALDYFASEKANRSQETMAKNSMAFTGEQTAQQMAFQERMSNTAYQRAVADLRAAGLNPLLAAGNAASTPSGASGSGSMGTSFVNPAGRLLTSALEGARFNQEMKLFKEQVNNAKEAGYNTRESTERIFEERRGLRLENDLLDRRNQFFKENPWAFKLNAASGGLNSASSILRAIK